MVEKLKVGDRLLQTWQEAVAAGRGASGAGLDLAQLRAAV